MLCLAVSVALTRELGKNTALLDELAEDTRIRAFEVPCVAQTRDADMDAALDAALESSWSWVVVTSAEAARTLGAALQRTEASGLRVATVGDATTRALPVSSAFSPSKATAKTLALELPLDGTRVLYPTSKLAASTLEDVLRGRGFDVHRVDAYTTVPAVWTDADKARAADADIVAFGSPSAVDVWVDRLGTNAHAVCIGETTAAACDAHGFQPKAFFPDKPGLAGWAAEIKRAVDLQAR